MHIGIRKDDGFIGESYELKSRIMRGGVEGWGEKAYNCNWITIQIFKKLKKYVFPDIHQNW